MNRLLSLAAISAVFMSVSAIAAEKVADTTSAPAPVLPTASQAVSPTPATVTAAPAVTATANTAVTTTQPAATTTQPETAKPVVAELKDGTKIEIAGDNTVSIVNSDGTKSQAPDGILTLKDYSTFNIKDGKKVVQ